MRPTGGVGRVRSLEEEAEEAEEVEGLGEEEEDEEAGLADAAAADREEAAADDEGVAVEGDTAEDVDVDVDVDVEVDGGAGLSRCSGGEEVLGERSMEASKARGPPDVGRKPSIIRSGPTCAGGQRQE